MTTKDILIHRDGMTAQEAADTIAATRDEVYNAIAAGDFDLAEEIFMADLGLETDYLLDTLI